MNKIVILPLKKIVLGQNHSRSLGITERDIKNFAESLEKNKFWEPPHVVKRNGEYKLIAGFRRYFSAQYLVNQGNKEFQKREFIVHDGISQLEADEINMLENANREDPHSYEFAHNLARMQNIYGLSGDELGKKCNKSKAMVNHLIRCAKCLHETIQNAWRTSSGDNEFPIKTLIEWSALEHDVQLKRFLSSKWGATHREIEESMPEQKLRSIREIKRLLEYYEKQQDLTAVKIIRWVLGENIDVGSNRDNGRGHNGKATGINGGKAPTKSSSPWGKSSSSDIQGLREGTDDSP